MQSYTALMFLQLTAARNMTLRVSLTGAPTAGSYRPNGDFLLVWDLQVTFTLLSFIFSPLLMHFYVISAAKIDT